MKKSIFTPDGHITRRERLAADLAFHRANKQVERRIMRNVVSDCGLERPLWRTR